MKSIILAIDGMTCSACSNGLEKYLNKQGFTYDSRYLKEGVNSPISVNYTGEQRWHEVLKDLLK